MDAGAEGYLVKPDFESLEETVGLIQTFVTPGAK
jgi:hypothetical protein